MNQISQKQFDDLAMFVAVADELRQEPFFGEDNHETLSLYATGECRAFFCHPAFLKSAVLPFRKLWLDSEPCAFKSIRDFVFAHHPEPSFANAFRSWFVDGYENDLNAKVDRQSSLTVRDVIEIWLYTHAVHAGPKTLTKKNTSKPHRTLEEFDQWSQSIGRERFEFYFRVNLRVIGSTFAEFEVKLARPLFQHLCDKEQMHPGFEAQAALKYNPYPDPRFKITFDDFFWHLNKESFEETFDRLLARQKFQGVVRLLVELYPTRDGAIAAVAESNSLDNLFDKAGVRFLPNGESTEAQMLCSGGGGSMPGAVGFSVYEGRLIRINDPELKKLQDYYASFREQLFEERKRQGRRPRWSHQTRWDS